MAGLLQFGGYAVLLLLLATVDPMNMCWLWGEYFCIPELCGHQDSLVESVYLVWRITQRNRGGIEGKSGEGGSGRKTKVALSLYQEVKISENLLYFKLFSLTMNFKSKFLSINCYINCMNNEF